MKKIYIVILSFLLFTVGCNLFKKGNSPKPEINKEVKKPLNYHIMMLTSMGKITLRLYNETPHHRDNFVKLVKSGFYDSLLFHRVINSFMIQGGDPQSKQAEPGKLLGDGDVGYRVPAEFNSDYIHKKGALAAARDNNPEKASSGCQFYIVQGKKYDDVQLDKMQRNSGWIYTPTQREIYKTLGGTPFLDNNYTVFGEVTEGLEVIDLIAAVKTDGNNRPRSDVRIIQCKIINQ